ARSSRKGGHGGGEEINGWTIVRVYRLSCEAQNHVDKELQQRLSAPPMFESANQGKASQVIVSQIREAVDSGRLKIGDRLPQEKELIDQFGFSRAVVREALRTLEAEGLIRLVSGRNGGAEICEPDPLKFVP